MQKQNKKDSQKDVPKELSYSIQTMNSDIKNQKAAKASFEIEEKEIKKKKPLESSKTIQPEPRKDFNPFLKNLNSSQKEALERSSFANNQPKQENKNQETSSFLKKQEIKEIKPETKEKSSILENSLKKTTPIKPVLPPKNHQDNLGKKPREAKSSNSSTLVVLLIISLITVFAGIYYFVSLNKTKINSSHKNSQEENLSESKGFPEASSETVSLENLFEINNLTLEEGDALGKKLLEEKDSVKELDTKYYQATKGPDSIDFGELLASLEIQLPEEILNQINQGLIVLFKENGILKLGILAKLTETESVISSINNNEYRMPEILKPLFIDESFVLQDEQIEFKNSEELPGVKYYNLVGEISSKSIDWGIVKNQYLIIATSKQFTESILNDLEQKKVSEVDEQISNTQTTERNDLGNEIIATEK